MPHGHVAPHGVPHGAVPHGAVPHGAVPHGAVPHGAVLHGAVPRGAVPHGAVPHGAVPHGAVPHGMVPHGVPQKTRWAARRAHDEDFEGPVCLMSYVWGWNWILRARTPVQAGARDDRTKARPGDARGLSFMLCAWAVGRSSARTRGASRRVRDFAGGGQQIIAVSARIHNVGQASERSQLAASLLSRPKRQRVRAALRIFWVLDFKILDVFSAANRLR